MGSDKNLEASKTKKGKKGEKNILLTVIKIVAVLVILGIQIALMILLYSTTRTIYTYARFIFEILKIITVSYILYKHDSAAYKISWIILVMLAPIVGILAYFLWGNSKLRKKEERKIRKIRVDSEYTLPSSEEIKEEIKKEDKHKYNQVNYCKIINAYI